MAEQVKKDDRWVYVVSVALACLLTGCIWLVAKPQKNRNYFYQYSTHAKYHDVQFQHPRSARQAQAYRNLYYKRNAPR